MTDIAKASRATRSERDAEIRAPAVLHDSTAGDGTRKWLLDVGGGNAIESVYIPEDDRGTLCVSSQAGCALDCAFCSTGKQGFNRNLSAGEIIGQLWHADRALLAAGVTAPWVEHGRHPITNVVMMGMGEPLANFDNVVAALRLMLDDHAYGLSRRHVTLSTSGLVPAIDRLREECPVALAVSLHAPNDALRDELVPINRKYPLRELLAACRRYIERAPRDFVTFEYVMLDGVNDSPAQARELVELRARGAVQVQPDPVQPLPEHRVRDQSARSHPRLPGGPARRRPGRHRAQHAWRRHRRRLRPAGRAGAGPHTAHAAHTRAPRDHARAHPAMNARTWKRLLMMSLLTSLAACSNKPTLPEPELPTAPPPAQKAPPEVRAKLHTELGAGYYQRGQMQVALDELNLAIQADPNYAQAYNIFGLVYGFLGEDSKAEQNFMRALQLAPNDSEIHHNWGWYLCTHGRERESLAEFETAVRNPLYKTPDIALINAGRCAQAIGDNAASETYFQRALAVQPGNPLASLGLAQLSYQSQRYLEARTWMKGVMLTTNPPPDALRLGACIERKLGDHQAELSYVSQLKNRYPDSPEAKTIDTESCQ